MKLDLKKIFFVIVVFCNITPLFSQGELTSDEYYLYYLNDKVVNIIKESIPDKKFNKIVKKELELNSNSLYVTIYQDSSGNILDVETVEDKRINLFNKKNIKKIKANIKKLEPLNIFVSLDTITYSSKKKFFTLHKNSSFTLVIKLSRVWDEFHKNMMDKYNNGL